jgi:polyisoprenoid-binding protein YceI
VTIVRVAPAAAVAALIAGAAAAAPERFSIEPMHTVPMFAVGHQGISVQRGLFGRAAGSVTIDRAAKSGTIDVAVDTASLTTGDALRDRVLRGEDFLDAARYPAATFRSTSIVYDGERPVAADGELTLRGVTRPLRVDIGPLRCGEQFVTRRAVCGTDVAATFKRSSFGMTAFAREIADDVALTIQVEALREKD